MLVRFRAEPDQANNLRVRVYTQDRATLLATVTTGITQHVSGSGSYECDVGNITGTWYVLVDLVSTGEVTSDGFASDSQSDVTDTVPVQTSITVLPGRDRAIPRSNRGQIILKLREEIVISRAVVDGNGNPVNLQGRTLQFVIQDARGTDVAVVESNAISISGTNHDTYSFAVPAAATARVFNGEYALNDLGAKSNLAEGDWIVQHRAIT